MCLLKGCVFCAEIRVRFWIKEVPQDGFSMMCSLSPRDSNEENTGRVSIGHYLDWNGDMMFTVDAGRTPSAQSLLRMNIRSSIWNNVETEPLMKRIGITIASLILLAILW